MLIKQINQWLTQLTTQDDWRHLDVHPPRFEQHHEQDCLWFGSKSCLIISHKNPFFFLVTDKLPETERKTLYNGLVSLLSSQPNPFFYVFHQRYFLDEGVAIGAEAKKWQDTFHQFPYRLSTKLNGEAKCCNFHQHPFQFSFSKEHVILSLHSDEMICETFTTIAALEDLSQRVHESLAIMEQIEQDVFAYLQQYDPTAYFHRLGKYFVVFKEFSLYFTHAFTGSTYQLRIEDIVTVEEASPEVLKEKAMEQLKPFIHEHRLRHLMNKPAH